MKIANERTLTGNRALLRLSKENGGQVVGVGTQGNLGSVQDVSSTTSIGLQDVYELGRAERAEIVVGAVRHSVTINYMLLAPKDSGFDPREIIQNDDDLVIDIQDKANGDVLESFGGCKLSTRNGTWGANRLVTQSLVFEARTAEKMGLDTE